MAQLLVRNLEAEVKARLERRAKRHNRSLVAEIREILRNAAMAEEEPARGLGSDIAALFAGIGLDADIPELRGHKIAPATFDE